MKLISIITPVYNEENNLPLLMDKFLSLKDQINEKNINLQLIFVNDGSNDNSFKILKNFESKYNFVKIINLTKNFGHQEAIFAGLESIDSDFYGVIDSDLQQDPILFVTMIDKIINDSCEVAQMQKLNNLKYENRLKIFMSQLFYKFFKILTKIDLRSGSSDFYLFTKKIRNLIISSDISKNFIRGFIHWLGYKTVFIEYTPQKRIHGKSNYSFTEQLNLGVNGIYYYSQKITNYILTLSIFVALSSLIYFIYIMIEHFYFHTQIEGWATIIALVLFFGAIGIFLNSLIVFFILKIFNIVSKKPFYIKKED